jgi:hypothetical protein
LRLPHLGYTPQAAGENGVFRVELVVWTLLFRQIACGLHGGDPNDRYLKPLLESSITQARGCNEARNMSDVRRLVNAVFWIDGRSVLARCIIALGLCSWGGGAEFAAE